MTHDFDRAIERRGTGSSKWFRYAADVLPLWVADMDFPSPEPVVRALRERVDHGVYGYGPQLEVTELSEVFADRLQKR
jgi:cystathionine beta-lyase